MHSFSLLVLAALSGSVALAADLKAPFDFESTMVLPAGVRNPRFKALVTYMDEKFGGSGGSEPLGYRLNKNITWTDVAEGAGDDAKKAQLLGYIRNMGLSDGDSAGNSSGIVNTYANVKVPVFAMGITNKLTLAVAVPIVHVEVNADTGLVRSDAAQAVISKLNQDDPDLAADSTRKLNDAVNSKLRRLGYQPIQSKTINNIGDIKAVGKYRIYENGQNALAVKGEVTFPSGVAPNADEALDIPTGDGAFSLGAGLVADHWLDEARAWRTNAYAGYVAQLPDHLERRLPVSDTDSLSADKELLARDRGDIFYSGVSMQHDFRFGLNTSAGYSFQYQGPMHYGDGRFAAYRYRLLEANTGQVLHAATLGLGFSTVEMYKRGAFKVPFQLNASYAIPLAGINVVKNNLLALEAVLFF